MSQRRNLQYLVPTPAEDVRDNVDEHVWATVTQASPLRIQLDTDSAPLPFTPITLVSGLSVSNRVLVLLIASADPKTRAKRVIVMGKPV